MVSIVRTIFGRLHTLNPTVEEARLLLNEEEPQHGEISMSVSTNITDADDSPLQAPEGVTSSTQQNAASLDDPERSAALEVEGPPQALSPPRPCKLPNLVSYFHKLNVM
jgi:brefeldin A-resistance guanine nucleotide exchange factor 1